VELGSDEHALDFPVVYSSGRDGWAVDRAEDAPKDGRGDIHAVFDAIIKHVPAPKHNGKAPLQVLITNLDWSDYVGRIGIGRVFAGTLRAGQTVVTIDRAGGQTRQKVGQLLRFEGLGRQEVDHIEAGDICAVVGLEKVDIGDTLADPAHPVALPSMRVDEPTIHMTFRINDGPFAGREGKYVTSRQLRERLEKELQSNVALRMTEGATPDEFEVSGRGLLHLGILLENMRREGYELCVGKPKAIFKTENGRRLEPIEHLVIDVPSDYLGAVMQLVGERLAAMTKMEVPGKRALLEFTIPARGLIGLRSRMLTATQGRAIMHHVFHEYEEYRGALPERLTGVMISTETAAVTAYALNALSDRGAMFVRPGEAVYKGQIVGECGGTDDIAVNVTRLKKLTNMRQSVKEQTVTLKAPRDLTLEAALEYIEDDELAEITPKAIRVRKRYLDETERRRQSRRVAAAEA